MDTIVSDLPCKTHVKRLHYIYTICTCIQSFLDGICTIAWIKRNEQSHAQWSPLIGSIDRERLQGTTIQLCMGDWQNRLLLFKGSYSAWCLNQNVSVRFHTSNTSFIVLSAISCRYTTAFLPAKMLRKEQTICEHSSAVQFCKTTTIIEVRSTFNSVLFCTNTISFHPFARTFRYK